VFRILIPDPDIYPLPDSGSITATKENGDKNLLSYLSLKLVSYKYHKLIETYFILTGEEKKIRPIYKGQFTKYILPKKIVLKHSKI
jgi:hypothetical protein